MKDDVNRNLLHMVDAVLVTRCINRLPTACGRVGNAMVKNTGRQGTNETLVGWCRSTRLEPGQVLASSGSGPAARLQLTAWRKF